MKIERLVASLFDLSSSFLGTTGLLAMFSPVRGYPQKTVLCVDKFFVDNKGKEEEVSPAEDSEFRKIVSSHEYDSSDDGFEKKAHELLGEDGF